MRAVPLAVILVALAAAPASASPRLLHGMSPRCARESTRVRGAEAESWWRARAMAAGVPTAGSVPAASAPVAAPPRATLVATLVARVGESATEVRSLAALVTRLRAFFVGRHGCGVRADEAGPVSPRPRTLTLF
jgi:hypothetical protein